MTMPDLDAMFRPRSIAVIGASREPESPSGVLFRNLQNSFKGALYAVNPNAREVQGSRSYESVRQIAGDVDLAFIATPSGTVDRVARECAAKGVRALAVISAGFAETSERGATAESDLARIAQDAGMRFLGPNCFGLWNSDPSALLTGVFMELSPLAGNVAICTQSGGLGIVLADRLAQLGQGISMFASVGNKADVDETDLIEYWSEAPDVDCIALYLESIRRPQDFLRVTRQASRGKPIVALYAGLAESGQRAAASHTAALASPTRTINALLAQAGVIQVDTLDELVAQTSFSASQPAPKGKRVGVLTNAGGAGVLSADFAGRTGLDTPRLSPPLQARLRTLVGDQRPVGNPIDLMASEDARLYERCAVELLASGEIDSLTVAYVPLRPESSAPVASALHRALDSAPDPKPVVTAFIQREPPFPALQSGRRRIPCFRSPEAAVASLSRAYQDQLRRERPVEPQQAPQIDLPEAAAIIASARLRLGQRGGWLMPDEIGDLLRACGIPAAATQVVRSASDAVRAARAIGDRVALKVVSPTVTHKSDVGGVVVGVSGERAVRQAYGQVVAAAPDSTGVLVQQMIQGGREALVGLNRDPRFGPAVVFGFGGVLAELVGDAVLRFAPLTGWDIEEMLQGTRMGRLLSGYRGSRPADIESVRTILLRISAVATALPELEEGDLNPVIVSEHGRGAYVVDARFRLASKDLVKTDSPLHA